MWDKKIRHLIAESPEPLTDQEVVFMAIYLASSMNRIPATVESVAGILGLTSGSDLDVVNYIINVNYANGILKVQRHPDSNKVAYLFATPPVGTYRFMLIEHVLEMYRHEVDRDEKVVKSYSRVLEDLASYGSIEDDAILLRMPFVIMERKSFDSQVTGGSHMAVVLDSKGDVVWRDKSKRIPEMERVSNEEVIEPTETDDYQDWLSEGFGHDYRPFPRSQSLHLRIEAFRYKFVAASWLQISSLDSFMKLAKNLIAWGDDHTCFDEVWEDGDAHSLWNQEVDAMSIRQATT